MTTLDVAGIYQLDHGPVWIDPAEIYEAPWHRDDAWDGLISTLDDVRALIPYHTNKVTNVDRVIAVTENYRKRKIVSHAGVAGLARLKHGGFIGWESTFDAGFHPMGALSVTAPIYCARDPKLVLEQISERARERLEWTTTPDEVPITDVLRDAWLEHRSLDCLVEIAEQDGVLICPRSKLPYLTRRWYFMLSPASEPLT
jgi:hypothetical protein